MHAVSHRQHLHDKRVVCDRLDVRESVYAGDRARKKENAEPNQPMADKPRDSMYAQKR